MALPSGDVTGVGNAQPSVVISPEFTPASGRPPPSAENGTNTSRDSADTSMSMRAGLQVPSYSSRAGVQRPELGSLAPPFSSLHVGDTSLLAVPTSNVTASVLPTLPEMRK